MTKLFIRTFLPRSIGYCTPERSFRLTFTGRRFEAIQISSSTTTLFSRASADLIVFRFTMGRLNSMPLYCGANLNVTVLPFIFISLASRDDDAAPVSTRAGRMMPHGRSMTSSVTPIWTFSEASVFFTAMSMSNMHDNTSVKDRQIFLFFRLLMENIAGVR